MPFFVCLFVAFSSLRNILPENSSMFSLSAVSGVVMNTPMDVVKSRMQNQPPGVAKYVWTLPSLLSILREEGPRSLWKGLGPRVIRLGPGGGIMLLVFDYVSDVLQRWKV
eukprot:m.330317 g.330317  ORF g.330317 m.330317 type:complete len:110 (+) comp55608_c0_seq16:752-1081(+)